MALNNYRENSLFRLHKVAFKTHHSIFTYNSYLEKNLRILVEESKKNYKWFFNDLIRYLPIKRDKKIENFICHHCKFIGPKKFFKKCKSHFNMKKINEEEIFKEIFFIKNQLNNFCNNIYCLNCL